MNDKEKGKARELVGRLKCRQELLRSEIVSSTELMFRMDSEYSQGYQQGRMDEMARWLGWSISILAEVNLLLTGGKNAEEEIDLPF